VRLASCYRELAASWNEELVVCSAGSASREWYGETKSTTSFYLQASMGISSMVSLGLALALPQARVWNFDGDGALVMNPGALLSEAETAPKNMMHFVLANRVYGATARHPFPNSQEIDFVGLARSCGIRRTYRFTDVEALADALSSELQEPEYAFVVLELEAVPGQKYKVPIDGPELKYSFVRHVERTFGVQVLGEAGF
jgi:sulfopyruvate decarboxylase subunit beta